MRKLIVGCGYLGRRVAALWRAEGHEVQALTRTAAGAEELKELGLEALVGDVLEPPPLPGVDTVLYAVGWDRASGKSMREVYVTGLERVLAKLPRPGKMIYVSSTSVYGQTDGSWVDEDAATEPGEESGRIVLAAEQVLRMKMPEACVLRFAGIYGPGRLLRQKAIEAGDAIVGDPERWLNLIHVDDGARAVLAAEQADERLVNVSDGQPVRRREFFEELARLLQAPPPRFEPPAAGKTPPHEQGQRRIDNRCLRERLRFACRHTSYREGLTACVGH